MSGLPAYDIMLVHSETKSADELMLSDRLLGCFERILFAGSNTELQLLARNLFAQLLVAGGYAAV